MISDVGDGNGVGVCVTGPLVMPMTDKVTFVTFVDSAM